MIDCPICHVKNNDDARFCAECGQRLTAQSSAPSLSEPIQAASPPRQAAPPPQQAAPPPAAQPERPKLKSPLLSGGEDEYSGGAGGGIGGPQQYGGAGGDDAGMNRLRQMGSRPQQPLEPAIDPNRPFKNPYDPRNAAPPENQPPSGQAEAPRKLRSPLLSGEEFDDSDFAEQDPPPANVRGGGLRSPLLGGGEGGGGGLRSPMLGGGRQGYDDIDEEPPTGGSGLRSPLLGGGGDYSGVERRRASDAAYGGQERRRGLRSPILGGAGGGEYYDDYEDEEPIDEDDPNVLRSPLLAARRPLTDRPRNEAAPSQSNAKNPPRPGQPPDIGRNLPNPSNSYTSLQAVRNVSQPQQQPPQAVPPAPTEPVPAHYQQQQYNPYQQPQQQPPQQAYQPAPAPQPSSHAPGVGAWGMGGAAPAPSAPAQPAPAPQAPSQPSPSAPPMNVPPSFSSAYTDRRPAPEPAAPVPTAQPVRPDEVAKFNRATEKSTEGSINVQAPISGAQPALPPSPPADEPVVRGGRRRPGLLSSGYEDEEEASSDYSAPSMFRNQVSAPPSPLPKIIGAVAMVLFLIKAFSFVTGFMASDWKQFSWLMMDQVTMLGIYLCVAVLAFTRKD